MASKKAAADEGRNGTDRWMISYCDLLTLLLAFFIVLYAQSSVNVSRLESVARGIILAFHGNPAVLMQQGHGGAGILSHRPAPIAPVLPAPSYPDIQARAAALQRAAAQLQHVLQPLVASQQVQLADKPLSLRIRLNAEILFANGSATLTSSARTLLDKVASVVQTVPNDYPIVVQGYTNDVPIHTAQFPSNWELSTLRAVNVVHLFIGQGIPGARLSAQGFSKYHPLIAAKSAQAKTQNRRVEIVIRAPAASTLTRAGSIPGMPHGKDAPRVDSGGAHAATIR